MTEPITITHSTEDNSPELWRLAALDDRRAPKGPALLAYVGGRSVPSHRRDRGDPEVPGSQGGRTMNSALSWAVATARR